MSKKETFEVTAYPIGSLLFVMENNRVLQVTVVRINLASIGKRLRIFQYGVSFCDTAIHMHPANQVFPTKEKLLNSL